VRFERCCWRREKGGRIGNAMLGKSDRCKLASCEIAALQRPSAGFLQVGPSPRQDRGPQLRHCTDEQQNIQLRCNKLIYCIPGYKSSPAESPIQTLYNERNQSERAPKQPYIAYKADELFCSRRGVNPAPQRHKQDLIRLP
jgi:hypothetical protein